MKVGDVSLCRYCVRVGYGFLCRQDMGVFCWRAGHRVGVGEGDRLVGEGGDRLAVRHCRVQRCLRRFAVGIRQLCVHGVFLGAVVGGVGPGGGRLVVGGGVVRGGGAGQAGQGEEQQEEAAQHPGQPACQACRTDTATFNIHHIVSSKGVIKITPPQVNCNLKK